MWTVGFGIGIVCLSVVRCGVCAGFAVIGGGIFIVIGVCRRVRIFGVSIAFWILTVMNSIPAIAISYQCNL